MSHRIAGPFFGQPFGRSVPSLGAYYEFLLRGCDQRLSVGKVSGLVNVYRIRAVNKIACQPAPVQAVLKHDNVTARYIDRSVAMKRWGKILAPRHGRERSGANA